MGVFSGSNTPDTPLAVLGNFSAHMQATYSHVLCKSRAYASHVLFQTKDLPSAALGGSLAE